MDKIENLKLQIECRYIMPCFTCEVLGAGNELFESRFSGNKLKQKYEQMRELKDGRQNVYEELTFLPVNEYCEFLGLIDSGFQMLHLDIHTTWGSEVEELRDNLKELIRKAKALEVPLQVSSYLLDERFRWTTSKPKGRPIKDFENYLIKQMVTPLLTHTTKSQAAGIVSDVFLYFYDIDKGIDQLLRRTIPGLKVNRT